MAPMQFLSSLPALLGLTGFAIYFFLRRNRGGDRITLDIVGKLRREAPDHLPAGSDKLDASTLAKLIESDATIRAKVSEQDFQLLRDALRQQFVTSLIVYGVCGAMFLAGIAFFVYMSARPTPLSVSAISAESTEPLAKGVLVDLDPISIRWHSEGDPEDVSVILQEMEGQRRSQPKSVRSTEGQITFAPDDYAGLLRDKSLHGHNRLRAVIQTSNSAFISPEFTMRVGITILGVRTDPRKLKIAAMIDNRMIDFYDFEAKLVVMGASAASAPEAFSYGGQIKYGKNDFSLDPRISYDWATAKIVYFGPDDVRTARTQLLGF